MSLVLETKFKPHTKIILHRTKDNNKANNGMLTYNQKH